MGEEKDHQHRWDDSGICIVCETSYVTIVAELAARLHEAEAALREVLRHIHEEPSSEESITAIVHAYFASQPSEEGQQR